MITFGIAIVTLILGFVIGWNIAGFIAYDDGVYDEKKHWYMHAHNWGCCAEIYMDNE